MHWQIQDLNSGKKEKADYSDYRLMADVSLATAEATRQHAVVIVLREK